MRRAGGLDRRRRAAAAQRDATRSSRASSRGKKFVYLCTNALLMEKKLDQYKPSPYFVWSVHLDGDREMHDHSVCQDGRLRQGAWPRCARRRNAASASTSTARCSTTPTRSASPSFFDSVKASASTASPCRPATPMSARPTRSISSTARAPSSCSATSSAAAAAARNWSFNQSSLFLDFLAGNQEYHCTPWGNPTRNVFGWQRPCYLLGRRLCRAPSRS